MKKIILLLTAILLLSFTSDSIRSIYQIPLQVRCICSADLDIDGDMDIITGHSANQTSNWGGISFLKNEDSGLFPSKDSIFIWSNNTTIIAEQLDPNASPSIVALHYENSVPNVAVINNALSEYAIDYYPMQHEYYEFTTGNINDDPFQDLVLIAYESENIYLGTMINDGTGKFNEAEYHSAISFDPNYIACGDFDNNGLDDVFLTGLYAEVYYNYSDHFEKLELENGLGRGHPFIVDFDGDKDLDIVCFSSLLGHSWISIQENIDGHSFNLIDNFSHPGFSDAFSVSDFDNDSLPDVVFHLLDNSGLVVYYNQGNLKLGNPSIFEISGGTYAASKISCNDYDNNGYNDVAFTVNTGSQHPCYVHIYFNDGHGFFSENPIVAINEKDSSKQSSKYNLACTPNPVRNQAIFSFALPEPTLAKLCVYNMQGKLITTLIADHTRNVKWDVNKNGKLTSGVYLVWLLVEGNPVESLKIVVL